jgi:hypothetical protein
MATRNWRKWKEENPEKIKEASDKYYRTHKEEILKREKIQRKNHAEYYKNYNEEYRKGKEKYFKNYGKKYRDSHKQELFLKARARIIKQKYGITLDDYEYRLSLQEGKCAICKCGVENNYGRNLAVDHNHETGELRGLLCVDCNRALGLLQDNINNVQSAFSYLAQYNE